MKLSTRARYGIHAMYDLACNDGAQPRPLKAVAEAQGIPEAYLEQLLCALRRSAPAPPERAALQRLLPQDRRLPPYQTVVKKVTAPPDFGRRG